MDWGSTITYLAETRIKGKETRFGIRDADRLLGMCIVGKVDTARVALLSNMILQDAERGMGTLVLDGVGDLMPALLEVLPEEAAERLITLDPSDGEHPYSWNPLNDIRAFPPEPAVAALSEILSALYQIENPPFTDFVARHMLDDKKATLLFLYSVITDPKAKDRAFPTGSEERAEFDALLGKATDAVTQITENGKYLAKDALPRNLLGQYESKFSLSTLSEGGIVVVDFSRVRMYPTRITPLVRVFAALARLHASPTNLVSVYSHDCLRYFSASLFERFFTEHSIVFTASDSSHGEEEKKLRERMIQRAGTLIAFSPHEMDFQTVERAFYPYVNPEEFEKLAEDECVCALAIDSVRSRPFFAKALPMPGRSGTSHQDIALASRNKYTTSRLKADELFKPKKEEESVKKEDNGSFSNAFRSIFAKSAAKPANGEAVEPAPAPKAPAAPKEKAPAPSKKEVKIPPLAPQKPAEIPVKKLKKMLHVRKVTKPRKKASS